MKETSFRLNTEDFSMKNELKYVLKQFEKELDYSQLLNQPKPC